MVQGEIPMSKGRGRSLFLKESGETPNSQQLNSKPCELPIDCPASTSRTRDSSGESGSLHWLQSTSQGVLGLQTPESTSASRKAGGVCTVGLLPFHKSLSSGNLERAVINHDVPLYHVYSRWCSGLGLRLRKAAKAAL